MFFMNPFQILERDGPFTFPGSFLDSLITDIGFALDVYDSAEVNDISHIEHSIVAGEVDLVLGFAEDVHVPHDASEDVPVGEQAAF